MATVTPTAVLTATPFPATTVAGVLRFELLAADGSVVATNNEPTAATTTFSNVAPGSYTVRATRLDAAGAVLGAAAVSSPFTIVAPVEVAIPTSITVVTA